MESATEGSLSLVTVCALISSDTTIMLVSRIFWKILRSRSTLLEAVYVFSIVSGRHINLQCSSIKFHIITITDAPSAAIQPSKVRQPVRTGIADFRSILQTALLFGTRCLSSGSLIANCIQKPSMSTRPWVYGDEAHDIAVPVAHDQSMIPTYCINFSGIRRAEIWALVLAIVAVCLAVVWR